LAADGQEHRNTFAEIMRLSLGVSSVLSLNSYVLFKGGKAEKMGTELFTTKTRERKGYDAGRTFYNS